MRAWTDPARRQRLVPIMSPVPAPQSSGELELDLELPSHPTSVAEARHAAGALARRYGAPEADVRLAVSEAVGNAVLHAFRGRDPGTISLSGRVLENRLVITVSDDGGGMRPNVDSTGLGLGLPLITKLAADARFDSSERGLTVSMSFLISSGGDW